MVANEAGRRGLAVFDPYWDTDGIYCEAIFVDDPRLSWSGPVEPPKETPQ